MATFCPECFMMCGASKSVTTKRLRKRCFLVIGTSLALLGTLTFIYVENYFSERRIRTLNGLNNLEYDNNMVWTGALVVSSSSTANISLNDSIASANSPITSKFQGSGSQIDAELFDKTKRAEAMQQDFVEDESKEELKHVMLRYVDCLNHHIPVGEIVDNVEFTEHEENIRKTCYRILFGHEQGKVCKWPSPELVGPLYVDMTPMSMNDMSETILKFVQPGGTWRPKHCIPRHKVAIVIPFRDRDSHLSVLLRQLHGILRRQELMYRVFVIEQDDAYPFNRGKLMNVGFMEALKLYKFTCFVFHDVDLIPENDRNNYGCPSSPRHVSTAVDKFGYRLPYESLFGGVEMFTRDHYEKVNGFSNSYWGWGAEDDDLYKRISEQGLYLTRPDIYEGRYKMIKHEESGDKNPVRHEMLLFARKEFQTDGVSSLQYTVTGTYRHHLYTHIKVDLNMEEDMIY